MGVTEHAQWFSREYSDRDLLRHLQAAAQMDGETPTYDRMRAFSRDHSAPHPSRYSRRFGGYNAAIREACLEPNMTGQMGSHTKHRLSATDEQPPTCPVCDDEYDCTLPHHMRTDCEGV